MPETALIVAHGQPSDPAPAAAEIAALAAKVAVHLAGWQVGSATLAE
ncbi:cobalamin biosynthesis protein CbiX, partial [Cereibacter changlensis]